jgi:hypothetical protein
MKKKLIFRISKSVYEKLCDIFGRRRVSHSIEMLLESYGILGKLENAYRKMAQEEEREAEALEWAEATLGDVSK